MAKLYEVTQDYKKIIRGQVVREVWADSKKEALHKAERSLKRPSTEWEHNHYEEETTSEELLIERVS